MRLEFVLCVLVLGVGLILLERWWRSRQVLGDGTRSVLDLFGKPGVE